MPREICSQCRRPQKVCFCHLLKAVDNNWPIAIVQHLEESRHGIGTAKIAQMSLSHCQTHVLKDKEEYFRQGNSSVQPILVYPGEGSISLQELKQEAPRPLIFLDGSWRKSRQMLYQSEYLQSLERCAFSFPHTSRYRIRKEPREGICSTLEAIVYVLKALESAPDKYDEVLQVMDWMIDQQIAHMGQAKFRHNYNSQHDSH